jgi:hypothetical protein
MVGRVPPSVLPRSSQLRRFRIFRVSAHRVLSSARVTPEKTLRSPSQRPATAAVGRRIVAAQDGGQLPRPAAARAWLGLVDAEIWTCEAAPGLPCRNRAVADKESHRWLRTAEGAAGRLAAKTAVATAHRVMAMRPARRRRTPAIERPPGFRRAGDRGSQ